MKKITQILMLFLSLTSIVRGQDFAPSQQAQGLLESKNVTVDYSTGIFHYKVPLYTLKSGDYELPISLDYTGKGVKVEDSSGLLGYNWTLNTGGVVTRTIRGGIADEDINGYLNTNPEMLRTNSIEIHKRSWDGECDIFTAVFNGQSVQFILQRKEGQLYGEPLERSNVRIECESNGYEINGFIVTDENGNRYIYRQKEWSSDINKEDAISFNGVRNKSYISSWYLSRIEPLNGEPILYTYKEYVNSEGEQNDIYVSQYTNTYKSKYHYGKPMRERPFDFSKYKDAFNANIEMAEDYIKESSGDLQFNYIYANSFETSANLVQTPDFRTEFELMQNNNRILGDLADLRNISSASMGLLQYLESISSYYFELGKSSVNAYFAWERIGSAANCIFQMLNDTVMVTKKEISNVTSYDIRTPLLSRIQCADQNIEFSDSEKHIKLCDLTGQRISECKITKSYYGRLTQIQFLDKDSIETSRIKFDYYTLPEDCKGRYNMWGYPYKEAPDYGLFESKIEYSRANSLKSITLANQGKIDIDYGLNRVTNFNNSDLIGMDFGGIRIQRLILKDNITNSVDTICYNYPFPGSLVMNFTGQEYVNYTSFSDAIEYSRAKPVGYAFTKTGNGGFYYPNVQEIIKGKGSKTYTFYVPEHYGDNSKTYSFWLNGLPISVFSYDESGKLLRMTKNIYFTDIPEDCPSMKNLGFLVQGDVSSKYNHSLPQVKAYDFYLDKEKIKAHYLTQKKVLLYDLKDGRKGYMNLYEEAYLPNIEPRTSVIIPDRSYNLYYGGATLLKEQVEYRYEDSVAEKTVETSDIPFMKTEYFYDNEANSIRPTRIVQMDSRSHVQTKIIKRVTEMDNEADSVFIKMKERNIINPAIKELTIRDGRVLNESVSCFHWENKGDRDYLELYQQYSYMPETTIYYQHTATDKKLFSYEKSNYVLKNTYGYECQNGTSLPVDICSRNSRTVSVYEPIGNQAILNAKETPFLSVGAMDLRKYDESTINNIETYKPYYQRFKMFYNIYKKGNWGPLPDECNEYMQSQGHEMMIEIIKQVAEQKALVNTEKMMSLLDSVKANENTYIIRFFQTYSAVFNFYPELNFPQEALSQLFTCFMDTSIMTKQFFESINYLAYYDTISGIRKISINSVQGQKVLKLYVLSKGASKIIPYTIKHSGGTTMKEINVPSASHYTVQTADIDISSYTGITSVDIDRTDDVVYMALVPAGVSFEATSYNLDRSVFAKFDQTGKLEVNEYDSAGRLIRITDENGNTVKEQTYNIVNY